MARKCPDCGHMNDNEMAFCAECGEPLDPQVRLVMELEGKKAPTKHGSRPQNDNDNDMPVSRPRRNRDDDDDDDYVPMYHEEEKKMFPVGLVIGLVAVAAVVWFLFFR